LTFHATGLWQFGSNLGNSIGTLANPSGLVSAHATRLDSFWLQQAFFHNRLFIRVGQFAGLDFYGNQEYGASYLIEPLDYAFGNLFSNTFESFNPAATPAAQIQFYPRRNLYIKSAVLAGNRNPYEQDPTGFHFQIRDTPVFVYEAGFTHDAEDLRHIDHEPVAYITFENALIGWHKMFDRLLPGFSATGIQKLAGIWSAL
jgi:porin